MLLKSILSPLGTKPLSRAALIFVAMVAARIAGEFGMGVWDGLIEELSNEI